MCEERAMRLEKSLKRVEEEEEEEEEKRGTGV